MKLISMTQSRRIKRFQFICLLLLDMYHHISFFFGFGMQTTIGFLELPQHRSLVQEISHVDPRTSKYIQKHYFARRAFEN
jgi:hypothetical protein